MTVDRRELAAISTGGAVGASARTALVEAAPTTVGHWPWVTFGVNLVGCLLLGYFVTRLQERLPVSAYQRPLLGTGLCGALTTFSTFQVDRCRPCTRSRPETRRGGSRSRILDNRALWLL
jgi:CrcB protein